MLSLYQSYSGFITGLKVLSRPDHIGESVTINVTAPEGEYIFCPPGVLSVYLDTIIEAK